MIHLGLILYAVDHGLSAEAILGRTRGSVLWGGYYGLFVVATAVHAPIGLRGIFREWLRWHGRYADLLLSILGLGLLALGLRAVYAVVVP